MTATDQKAQSHDQPAWKRFVVDTREAADSMAAANLLADPGGTTKALVVVAITAALALTSINFFAFDPTWLVSSLRWIGLVDLADSLGRAFTSSVHAQFWQLVHWAAVQVGSYTVFPLLAARVLKLPVRDLGLRFQGQWRHGRIYLVLLAASLPFVALASLRSDFVAKYPFYHPLAGEGVWPFLGLWWVLYALQFVALEFFFRGFMIHGLKHRLGFAAVFAMVIPYNMIHFQKPLLEALAAILGGSVLGILSLRTRSIWWGAALHISIAGTMDVLSLTRQGWF